MKDVTPFYFILILAKKVSEVNKNVLRTTRSGQDNVTTGK